MAKKIICTKALADRLFKRLAEGESLMSICRDKRMPSRTVVYSWLNENKNGFTRDYAHARAVGLDVLADEIIEISDSEVSRTESGNVDSADVQRKRLQVDARKWTLAKLAPTKYGERSSLELTGKDGGPIEYAGAKERLRKLIKNRTKKNNEENHGN